MHQIHRNSQAFQKIIRKIVGKFLKMLKKYLSQNPVASCLCYLPKNKENLHPHKDSCTNIHTAIKQKEAKCPLTALDPLTTASGLSYMVAPFTILPFLLYHVPSLFNFSGLPVTGRMKPRLLNLVQHQTSLPATMGRYHTLHAPALRLMT